MTNTNIRTGVRFGSIYLKHINSEVAQELWYTHGVDLSWKDAIEELTNEVRQTLIDEEWPEDDLEDELEYRVETQSDNIQIEEPNIEGECEGVHYTITWLGGAPLLMVFESPHIANHGLCSPCLPNCGDIEAEGDYECYTIPESWLAEDF